MMNTFIPFLLLICLLSCLPACQAPDRSSGGIQVFYHGALKKMMKEGDISSKYNVAELADSSNIFGLGAFENLKGEIQIFNSLPLHSFVHAGSIGLDSSFNIEATLMVYARVPKWHSITFSEQHTSTKRLEKFIAEKAKRQGINIKKPFPFILECSPDILKWHIINWKEGDTEHSHEKHIASGLSGTLKMKKVEIIGFYSSAHKGIFTHHTSNSHMHFKSHDETIAGHVDELIINGGGILKLPEVIE